MIKTKYLFIGTFFIILATYLSLFGIDKSLEIIKEEYLSILALIFISFSLLYFKIKLKDYELINFLPKNNISFKSTVGFFLIFQIIDYYYEYGLIGMISQWFLYWIM